MITKLVIADEGKTQAESGTPLPASGLFLGPITEILTFGNKLGSDSHVYYMSRKHGLIPADRELMPYHVDAKTPIQNRKSLVSSLSTLFNEAERIFIFLPTFWLSIVFTDDVWKGCKARQIYISAGAKGIELAEKYGRKYGIPVFGVKRVGVAPIGHENQAKILEHMKNG